MKEADMISVSLFLFQSADAGVHLADAGVHLANLACTSDASVLLRRILRRRILLRRRTMHRRHDRLLHPDD